MSSVLYSFYLSRRFSNIKFFQIYKQLVIAGKIRATLAVIHIIIATKRDIRTYIVTLSYLNLILMEQLDIPRNHAVDNTRSHWPTWKVSLWAGEWLSYQYQDDRWSIYWYCSQMFKIFARNPSLTFSFRCKHVQLSISCGSDCVERLLAMQAQSFNVDYN